MTPPVSNQRRPTVPTVSAPCEVVIVEDEPISRKALQTLVTAHGFTTRAYPTAEAALEGITRDGVPAVALVDFHLPGMNGIEFIRRIEQASRTVLPVLLTAAGADELDRIRRMKPVLCIRKPIDFPRLMALLQAQGAAN